MPSHPPARRSSRLRGLSIVPGILFVMAGSAWAQTNPAIQSLPYSQSWGTATFTSMPAGTAGWNGVNGGTVSTQALAEASAPTGDATVTAATAAQTTGGSYGY